MPLQDEEFLKRFLEYCRARCSPRLTESAADLLENEYVAIRREVGLAWMQPLSLELVRCCLPDLNCPRPILLSGCPARLLQNVLVAIRSSVGLFTELCPLSGAFACRVLAWDCPTWRAFSDAAPTAPAAIGEGMEVPITTSRVVVTSYQGQVEP